MKLNPVAIFIFLFLFTGISSQSQTPTVSPYSRFGIGELLFNGYAHQAGKGGSSIGDIYTGRLNFSNPASYAYDTLSILEFGIDGQLTKLKQGNLEADKKNSSLSYLSIGFPLIRHKWGMAFGVIPYSGTGYDIRQAHSLDSVGYYNLSYKGSGGYTRYYIGTGFKLGKHFSAGVNASYLFGTINRDRRIVFSNSNFLNNRYSDGLNIGDFYFEGGINWQGTLNAKHHLSIGLTGAPAQVMSGKNSILWDNFIVSARGEDIVRDTVQFIEDRKIEITLPVSFGIGMVLTSNEKLKTSVDFTMQNWSEFEYNGTVDSLDNSYRVSAGAEWMPDPKSLNYWSRAQYRGGLYFNRTYLNLRNTPVDEMGITLGVGLPLRKAYQSMVNIAIQAGRRGTTSDNLVQEDYLKLMLGLTFNEDWFRKRRYD